MNANDTGKKVGVAGRVAVDTTVTTAKVIGSMTTSFFKGIVDGYKNGAMRTMSQADYEAAKGNLPAVRK